MKHVKIIGLLVGVGVSFASKEWYQKEIARTVEEDEKNRNKNRNRVSARVFRKSNAACATMDKEEEISAKLLNVLNENKLGIKCVFISIDFFDRNKKCNAHELL